ncbi:MAG: NUDIX hydrolase [Anaerolineales bacterium]
MPFELLHSEIVYSGRAFTIRRDRVRLPDGRQTTLDIVEHVGSVVVLPLDDEGNLLFVRQYRHAAGLDLLELPAGTLEAGEAPEACARREVREETGMAAGRLEHLGGFYLAPGYSTEYMHVYLAAALYPAPLAADADEFLAVEKVPLAEALSLPARGLLPDAKSLAALLLARERLTREAGLF